MDARVTRPEELGRRGFLRLGAAAAGGLVLPRWLDSPAEFPDAARLGRVCIAGKVDVKARPDADSATVDVLYEDAVVTWLHERVGNAPLRKNQRWVETERGYIWSPQLQPVKNLPNVPVETLPETEAGPGFWAEVTVPYVDVVVGNPPARSPYLREAVLPRLYFSQIVWIDQVRHGGLGPQVLPDQRALRIRRSAVGGGGGLPPADGGRLVTDPA